MKSSVVCPALLLLACASVLFPSCSPAETFYYTPITYTTTTITRTETITPPLATSSSRIASGFQFTVTVSNVRPLLGENVVISAELLNLYNTTMPVDQLSGVIVLEITNDSGSVVWRETDVRQPPPTTTPAPPVGTGFTWKLTRAWTAGGNYAVPSAGTYTPVLPIAPGAFFLAASTTLFGLAVTPIQITVSDWSVLR